MPPIVSVLMSIHNGGVFLAQSIHSLEIQTECPVEFLVMDDGSTDGTGALLETWEQRDPRVRLQRKTKREGLTQALNELIALSQAAYVARQDADDLSAPQRLFRQAHYLDQHPEIALVGCAYDLIDDENARLDTLHPPERPGDLKAMLAHRNILAHGSWMARRSALLDVGMYRTFFRYAQDYDLLLRLIERFPIGCLPDTLYQLRLTATSLSLSKRHAQRWFARTARECSQRRAAGKSDIDYLNSAHVPERNNSAVDRMEGERFLLLQKALHALKNDEVDAARSYLSSLPWSYQPLRRVLLRALCNVPDAGRDWIFRRHRKRSFLS